MPRRSGYLPAGAPLRDATPIIRQTSQDSVKPVIRRMRNGRRHIAIRHAQPSSFSRFCGIWLAWASMATLACITTCLDE